MSRRDLLVAAHCLLREYDGSTVTAAAEIWAEEELGMVKADKGTAGFDGVLPDGRKLQVKSKKADAHSDAVTYVELSKSTLEQADDLLIVFVDYATCEVTRTIGPVPVDELSDRKGRYYVSDILDRQRKSLEVQRDRRREHAAWVIGQIVEWRAEGMGYRRIAALLNRGEVAAPRGGTWQANQVRRIWDLVASESLQYALSPMGESEAPRH